MEKRAFVVVLENSLLELCTFFMTDCVTSLIKSVSGENKKNMTNLDPTACIAWLQVYMSCQCCSHVNRFSNLVNLGS